MLQFVEANLFELPVQTRVNATNTQGIMGAGIAKAFKDRYPRMFKGYKLCCEEDYHTVARPHLFRMNSKDDWILNLATKDMVWNPSNLQNIALGLVWLLGNCEKQKITSIGFPALGCGLGGLKWEDVKPVMQTFLEQMDIPVYVCKPQ